MRFLLCISSPCGLSSVISVAIYFFGSNRVIGTRIVFNTKSLLLLHIHFFVFGEDKRNLKVSLANASLKHLRATASHQWSHSNVGGK